MSYYECLASLEIGLIYGIVALGIYLTFRIIDFPDLTCDGSFVCGAATSIVTLQAGYSPAWSLVMALMAGAGAGLLTGALHLVCKVTDLLSGILTAFMLYSINLKIMHGVPNITLVDQPTLLQGIAPLITLLLVAAAISILVIKVLYTDLGLGLRSIGQNKKLARMMGVSVPLMTLMGLMLSNALISLAGALFSQHQGYVDVSQGVGTVIVGLAAVMIGEKILPFRSLVAAVLSCIAGSILYRFFVAFALHSEWLGLETSDLNLITGLMVAAIMWLPKMRRSAC